MEIVGHTGRQIYAEVVEYVLGAGVRREPRGKSTLDAGFVSILLQEPIDALPTGTGRGVIKSIAAVEALQLVAAHSDPDLVMRIAPKFRDYAEEDETFHGAYGHRIGYQMPAITRKLTVDPHTRQAVATLWDSRRDNLEGKRDYPCTVALQFEVREDGALCMNTVMRSNDVWLGLPYDLFQFTQLQMTLAHALDRKPGWYRHTVLSMHAYTEDIDNLRNVHPPRDDYFDPHWQPRGIKVNGWHTAAAIARKLMITRGDDDDLSQKWYADALEPYYDAPNMG